MACREQVASPERAALPETIGITAPALLDGLLDSEGFRLMSRAFRLLLPAAVLKRKIMVLSDNSRKVESLPRSGEMAARVAPIPKIKSQGGAQ